jgi:broad specificity phosphatase PhoE
MLVRHGAHDEVAERLTGRGPDGGLSPVGRAQVAGVAQWLSALPLAAVIASPRGRTQQTAQAIASSHGLDVITDLGFDEIDFGDWTGRAFSSLQGEPAWDAWNAHRATGATPGGESMAGAQDRAWAALTAVAERYSGAVVAVVTHCDIIRALVCRVLGLSLDRILSFDADPASVTRLQVGAWGARLTGLNQIAPAA